MVPHIKHMTSVEHLLHVRYCVGSKKAQRYMGWGPWPRNEAGSQVSSQVSVRPERGGVQQPGAVVGGSFAGLVGLDRPRALPGVGGWGHGSPGSVWTSSWSRSRGHRAGLQEAAWKSSKEAKPPHSEEALPLGRLNSLGCP